MKYIESPETYIPQSDETAIFLAGGITGCPDWQQDLVKMLKSLDLVVLNPRRKKFPINKPEASKEQIQWEYKHLRLANQILFWFPRESICPIALYELGVWSNSDKPLFLGVHPEYPRRVDIEEQIRIARPEIRIVYLMTDLVDQLDQYNNI